MGLMLVAVFARFAWRGVAAFIVLLVAIQGASFARQHRLVARAYRACAGEPVTAHVDLYPLVVPSPSRWVRLLAPMATTALWHRNRHPAVAAVFRLPGHPTLRMDVGLIEEQLREWSGTCRLHGDIGDGGVAVIEHPVFGLLLPTGRLQPVGHAPLGRWSPVVKRDPEPGDSIG